MAVMISGTTQRRRRMEKIIVSLTTYPARIATISQVIDCMINQTVHPDKIILYLAKPQFEGQKLPLELEPYKKWGVEVHWCEEDIGPHKKYFYALQEYPNDIVITIDDDFYYKRTLISELMECHKKFSRAIIARKAHLITYCENGNIAPYLEWYGECIRYINIPRMDLCAIGCSGILYPPHVFVDEVFNKDFFMQSCRYADDIWLKFMEVLSDVPVVLAGEEAEDLPIKQYFLDGLYQKYNGVGGNDTQICNVLNKYNKYHSDNDTLLKRIFSGGGLQASKVDQAYNDDLKNKISHLVRKIENANKVVIYGAGTIANRIYMFLRESEACERLNAFVVDNEKDNPQELFGYPVKNYRKYISDTKTVYVIGLAQNKQEEVMTELIQAGICKDRIISLDKNTHLAMRIFMGKK